MKKTVFITGAGGFIGFHIAKRFSRAGWNVAALVHNRVPDKLKELKNVTILRGDVTDRDSMERCLKELGRTPDIVVHAAGRASDIGPGRAFRTVNYESVKIVADIPAEKLIYISTTDVYGIRDFNGEDEQLPYSDNIGNPYPEYKIKSEQYIRNHLPDDRYVILRPAAVWGDGDETLENRVAEFLKKSPFIVHFGKWKGKNRWPSADVTNVAEAAYRVSCRTVWDGEAINILDGTYTTIDQYYRNIAEKHFPDKKFRTVFLPLWTGRLIGRISTGISNLLRLKRPLFDPTFYSVHHISSNLDFSNARLIRVLNSPAQKKTGDIPTVRAHTVCDFK